MLTKKIIHSTEEKIKEILEGGIEPNNLEYLDKLVDINKDAYEIECMKEGEDMYGNYPSRNYGRYGRDSYNARRRDSRGRYTERGYGEDYRDYSNDYRGHEYIDEMHETYGRYMESRERYGANEDTMKSLKYMLESMEDFARMLKDDAQSQEEVDMIRQSAQRIAQM